MRRMLCIAALLLVCGVAYAQADSSLNKPNTVIRICTPSRGQIINPPLYLVFYGKHQAISTNHFNIIQDQIVPTDIKSINVLKAPEAMIKYCEYARFGAVEIYLKRGKHPEKNRKAPVDTLTRYRR